MRSADASCQKHVIDVTDKCIEPLLSRRVLSVLVEVVGLVSDEPSTAGIKPNVATDNDVRTTQVVPLNRVNTPNFPCGVRSLHSQPNPVLLNPVPPELDTFDLDVVVDMSLPRLKTAPRLGHPRPGKARNHSRES